MNVHERFTNAFRHTGHVTWSQSDELAEMAEKVHLRLLKEYIESQKPWCFIQHDGKNDWWIVIPGKMRTGIFPSKKAATAKALSEGLVIRTPPTEFLDVY